MLGDHFRVSVGAPEENDKLIKALREIFDGEQSGDRGQKSE
jgi:histidinol-phosphate/aromatic aminotransferase/cobyric acid decarboxylase-like protein